MKSQPLPVVEAVAHPGIEAGLVGDVFVELAGDINAYGILHSEFNAFKVAFPVVIGAQELSVATLLSYLVDTGILVIPVGRFGAAGAGDGLSGSMGGQAEGKKSFPIPESDVYCHSAVLNR
jgi:hypothetical protein